MSVLFVYFFLVFSLFPLFTRHLLLFLLHPSSLLLLLGAPDYYHNQHVVLPHVTVGVITTTTATSVYIIFFMLLCDSDCHLTAIKSHKSNFIFLLIFYFLFFAVPYLSPVLDYLFCKLFV